MLLTVTCASNSSAAGGRRSLVPEVRSGNSREPAGQDPTSAREARWISRHQHRLQRRHTRRGRCRPGVWSNALMITSNVTGEWACHWQWSTSSVTTRAPAWA
jgi:hypothetical protein